ncbi:tryptophan--tRNA ligase [Mesoplasma lactucae ATCC 49193]|uniref:Tryptophan--tRNA ligase n=2 Tax=Mesoplasma lactucae TaxID=138853 RepID=A0A291ISE3_9MOLU|nr:tryptophan--tRNA ligase [Mesoplasma lactucae ATCC 49193]
MKKMVTAVASSGTMTIGNYFGVIKQVIQYQNEYDLYLFIANLHAITMPQDKTKLKQNIKTMATLYFACGLDPQKATIFVQSDVLEHAQLGWILNTQATMGELERMTQFKDKSQKVKANNGTSYIPAGLFTYPTLMAADILLYDANYVPVGVDQIQHVELTRNLAERMNHTYGEDLFTIPEHLVPKKTPKIMDLQEPSKKMSKSNTNEKTFIRILDEPEVIKRKIGSALTDSEDKVYFDAEKKPGISNLMTIYSAITNKDYDQIQKEFENKNYKDFKDAVAEALISELEPIQIKFKELWNSPQVDEWLDEGANKARKIAYKKLMKVQNRMGLNYKRK